jgi:hypothetical protein
MSVEQVNDRDISGIANRQSCAVGTECDAEWDFSVSSLPWRNDQLEVAVIKPDPAVFTRRGEPTVSRECQAVDLLL